MSGGQNQRLWNVDKAAVEFCQVVSSLLYNGPEGENMVCILKIDFETSLASSSTTQSVQPSRENNVQNYGIECGKGMFNHNCPVVAWIRGWPNHVD